MTMVSAGVPADDGWGDCEILMTTQADRLFLLLDPHTRRVADICTGPTATGDCPAYLAGQPLTCAGFRVVPIRQTSANGLPFLVDESEGPRCPLAWLDDAGGARAASGRVARDVGHTSAHVRRRKSLARARARRLNGAMKPPA